MTHLDGTKEFIARNGEFAVDVTLIEADRSILGVVYAPAIDALYWGGQHLVAALQSSGNEPRLFLRHSKPKVSNVFMGDLDDFDSLSSACKNVDTVFHCAGYAHAVDVPDQSAADRPWQVNFEGTRNLFLAAAQCGVKRFVFLSSVKAMPEPGEECVNEGFVGEPKSAHGRAKRAAERFLLENAVKYGMQVCILRLSIVYGPGSRGNLERMMRLVRRGLFPLLNAARRKNALRYLKRSSNQLIRLLKQSHSCGNPRI